MNEIKIYPVRLFYSYCHEDKQYRESMEKALTLLKRKGELITWSDNKILPGKNIDEEIKSNLNKADILVFLLSNDFFDSDACMDEWNYAKSLSKPIIRVPIILRHCKWKDMLGEDNLKALPFNGTPVDDYSNPDKAWNEIYDGIKYVIDDVRNTFIPKPKYLNDTEKTLLISQDSTKLKEVFVFPKLLDNSPTTKNKTSNYSLDKLITKKEQLFNENKCVIYGEEMCGKSTLAHYLYLSLIEEEKSVIHIDMEKIHGAPNLKTLQRIYRDQYSGDFSLWFKQKQKYIIIDNFSASKKSRKLLDFISIYFEKIYVMIASDVYHSFYRDDKNIADYKQLKIESLSHVQQQELIKKQVKLTNKNISNIHYFIDQIEYQVNSLIDNKIIPRYPFYILTIVQTVDAYLPTGFSVTSYGHCFYVWILSQLDKAGIDRRDEEIDTCMNFCENLAFSIYEHRENYNIEFTKTNFDDFLYMYRSKYIIEDAIINRLQHSEYGILSANGTFLTPYMYYYFLAKYLSDFAKKQRKVIKLMCKHSHITANHITLQFVIHHSGDWVIDLILNEIEQTFNSIIPACLDQDETAVFKKLIDKLPSDISSSESVDVERRRERERRDIIEAEQSSDDDDEGDIPQVNDIYRILKNNKILGQVLRNKHGKLEKKKIANIIETVSDGGLRLVSLVLRDEKEMTNLALFLKEIFPDDSVEEINYLLQVVSFSWVILNIESIVNTINSPKIREVLVEVVQNKSTPAYDIIEYFSMLDSAKNINDSVANKLEKLRKKYTDSFVREVISRRTQRYMNTHEISQSIEQRIHHILELKSKYKPKYRKQ